MKLPHLMGYVLCGLVVIVIAQVFFTAQDDRAKDSATSAVMPSASDADRVHPVVASIETLAQNPIPSLRPNREGQEDSRIESTFTEAEIQELMAKAMLLPADPGVEQFSGAEGGGLDFTAGTSFDSIEITEAGFLNPPDPELAVGPNHVVAVVNSAVEVYDKTGTSLVGPIILETFFQSLGVGCTIFAFDPNVLYDEVEDRYIIAADGNGSEYCVAVSQTGDAAGTYNFYAFPVNVNNEFFDYPHAGVGVDAIYVGANMFGAGSGRIFAFEKAAMYAGTPAASATHFLGSDTTPQPMNVKGAFPTNGKHYIATTRSGVGVFALYSWEDPFGADTLVDEGSFDLSATHGVAVGFSVNSPQMGGGSINSFDARPLDFEYRNGSAWIVNSVSCNPGAGTVNCVQWGEIDVATVGVNQAGVFGTDGEYRIFPDLAVNACGDLAIGYTKTTASIFPSVWIAGRSAGDPPGTIQGEVEIKAGEVASGASRWGDYSGMTADPDGQSLWYLGEYSKDIAAGSNWGNFVGSVVFGDCSQTLFEDGFESGDTSQWSSASP